MKLRRPCQHGRYELHAYLTPDGHPESSIAYRLCPGGVFLPDDTLTGRLVGSKWNNRRLWTLEMFGDIDASAGAEFALVPLDALSVREAE